MSHDKELHLYISRNEIHQIIHILAENITQTYRPLLKKDESLLAVVTLKGALFFAADLIRHIGLPVTIDYVRVSSYGSGQESNRAPVILKDLETPITDRHVLILDEIIDTGHTMSCLLEFWKKKKPASIRIGTLLSKPSRRIVDIPIDFVGKEIEDKFVVGYGLDFNEKYRNLPEIFYM